MGYSSTEEFFVPVPHKQVHSSKMFSAGYHVPTLADNGNLDILIQVGANPIHIGVRGSIGGDGRGFIYEAPTISDVGTALVAANHRRSSSNVTTAIITHTPTVTLVGTQFNGTFYIPGGAGGKAIGGEAVGFDSELILAPNTDYLYRLTNISGQAREAAMHATFYEPDL